VPSKGRFKQQPQALRRLLSVRGAFSGRARVDSGGDDSSEHQGNQQLGRKECSNMVKQHFDDPVTQGF
jgi:hypothetical protein